MDVIGKLLVTLCFVLDKNAAALLWWHDTSIQGYTYTGLITSFLVPTIHMCATECAVMGGSWPCQTFSYSQQSGTCVLYKCDINEGTAMYTALEQTDYYRCTTRENFGVVHMRAVHVFEPNITTTFKNASQECSIYGGMVAPYTQDVIDSLWSLRDNKDEFYWVAANVTNGEWTWLTGGLTFNDTNSDQLWLPGQPSGAGNCVALNETSVNGTVGFMDMPCDDLGRVFCWLY